MVRHLAAGVLGANAPAPLKQGLEQTLDWDGRDDDGRPATGGPFKVRVGLGLTAAYGGKAFAEKDKLGPNNIEAIWGLAAGADGRVYVMGSRNQWLYWWHTPIHVFLRDGSYERTIQPFPANLKPEQLKDLGAFVPSGGRLTPLIHDLTQMSFYPGVNHRMQHMAVTPDGNLIVAVKNDERLHLAALGSDGSVPYDTFAGAALGGDKERKSFTTPYMASALDGGSVFLTGFGTTGKRDSAGKLAVSAHAVHRLKLPERGVPEVFFGDPETAGADEKHLSEPQGLAIDGKGHLLVADRGNNRVVILAEKDGAFVGSFAATSPEWLGISRRTGVIYVQSGESIVRFAPPAKPDRAGWKDVKETGRTAILAGKFRYPKNPKFLSLAVDPSAEPAVLWAGWGSASGMTAVSLFRCEDRGGTFGDWTPAKAYDGPQQRSLTADPLKREVLCAVDRDLIIRNDVTGEEQKTKGGGNNAHTFRLGPDGLIYSMSHDRGVTRFDRNGNAIPFPSTADHPLLRGRLGTQSSGTTAWERDFGIDRKGDIYVKSRTTQYHGLMTVPVFGQDGAMKRTAIYTVSDGAYGPRIDARGNIYIMEAVCPDNEPMPADLAAPILKSTGRVYYELIYGSVIKFGPEGGSVWFSGSRASSLDYDGWLTDDSIKDLRTTGGSLTGQVVKKPATLTMPELEVLDASSNKIVMRLKNDSDGTQAVLGWHTLGEGYGTKAKTKAIEIKPNSDFTEYTFDMSGEEKWKGKIIKMTLVPTNAAQGSFCLDWVRVGVAFGKPAWEFDKEDSAETKLPADMKKESLTGYGKPGTILQGHQWWRFGFSPLGRMRSGTVSCHCTGSDFDVDDFGRTFAPDNGRSRLTVLDAGGNVIAHIGAYGNQDFCGPESYVLDPKDKFLRARRDDDPKDLVSPFAEPEIALAWTVAVAATDSNLYVADSVNRRVLRLKLAYALEVTVPLP
ncbi:MAG: hypothetical protein L6R28_07350 [Planctomycetes bacterium]|nr:hypothetical protein [Planctomycetota bacterium]